MIPVFVKTVDKESEEFVSLKQKCPKINEAKIKEGIFVGPQITLFKKQDFSTKLNFAERKAWKAS